MTSKRRIGLVITNPNHHWEMVRPIAKELIALGHQPILVSYCGLRRLADKDAEYSALNLEVRKGPCLRKLGLKSSSAQGALGGGGTQRRQLAQSIAWQIWLKYRLKPQLRDLTHLLVLNDQSFPMNFVVQHCIRQKKWIALLQEGIRFPAPSDTASSSYGCTKVNRFYCWGEASRRYFQTTIPRPHDRLVVTGSPRFNSLLTPPDSEQVAHIRMRYDLTGATIGLASNPIDDLGFCSSVEKYQLVRRFLISVLPVLRVARAKMLIKLHPRENVSKFESIIAETGSGQNVALFRESAVSAFLNVVDRVVIMASTVGLEALAWGKPIAVLPIPGHGYVHDYVSSGAALGLNLQIAETQFAEWLDQPVSQQQFQYVKDHLEDANAAQLIAKELTDVPAS